METDRKPDPWNNAVMVSIAVLLVGMVAVKAFSTEPAPKVVAHFVDKGCDFTKFDNGKWRIECESDGLIGRVEQ